MKVSDYIADLLSKKTQYVFGGQGGSVVHIVNSIDKNKKMKFIPGQNEQASAIAADAYHRVSGKLAVAVGTSGPGILNLLQGVACSFFDSMPALFISGAPVLNQIRRNKKIRQIGFQEMEVVDLVKPITKYAVLLKDIKKIRYEFEKAIHIAYTGRKGPVLIDLPDDIQRMEINPKKQEKFVYKNKNTKNRKFILNKVKKISKFLKNSKRPLIIVGNGVKLSKSESLIKKFIKKNGIPYAPTWASIDIFNSNDELNVGTFGVAATRHGNFAIQNSDLLLFLGARISPQILGSNPKLFSPNSKKIIIDIDKNEFYNHRLPKISLKINSDVKSVLEILNKTKLKKKILKDWKNNIKLYKKKFPVVTNLNYKKNKFIDPYAFFAELSKITIKNDIIIPDASANLIWCMQGISLTKNEKIFTALNHSPMGYSVPASIGAYFGNKKSRIIATIGDGSMQMNVQELETIKNYQVNTKIFILNNKGYGLIKQTQETWLDSNYAGVDKSSGLSMPDFLKVAKAYKIKAINLKNNNNLRKRLKKILGIKGPVVINVNISPKKRVTPKIDFGNPLHDMSPKLDKKVIDRIILK